MIKSGNRSQPAINRQSDLTENGDHWLREFENKLQRVAVQPRGKDLYDQITSIMNTKSKYTSVQQAVVSMMERSGLTNYLDHKTATKNKADKSEHHRKLAQQIMEAGQNASAGTEHATSIESQDDQVPDVIKEKPAIRQTLDNLILDGKGNISIPAILGRLKALHASDIGDDSLWEDDKLLRLVSQLNLQAKKDNPSNFDNYEGLGRSDRGSADSEIDRGNTDAFHALQPAKTH